ncbi:MAG: hypothetical protein PVF07_05090, partial [Thiogranum sp.]
MWIEARARGVGCSAYAQTTLRTCMCLLALLPFAANGYDYSLSGFVGVESRLFAEDGQFAHQFDTFQNSLVLQPEFTWLADS